MHQVLFVVVQENQKTDLYYRFYVQVRRLAKGGASKVELLSQCSKGFGIVVFMLGVRLLYYHHVL